MFFLALPRVIAGMCFSFVYIAILVQIGDNVPKNMRGYVSTTLTIIPFLGQISPLSFYLMSSNSNSIIYYHWTMMALITLTLCLAFKKTPEPISWYLKSKNIDKAQNALNNLWHGIIDPIDIQNELNERIKLSSEDCYESDGFCFFNIFTNGNWKPIFWMLLLRVLNNLATAFQIEMLESVKYLISLTMPYFSMYISLFLIFILCILVFIPAKYGLDTLGRKLFLFIGLFSGIPLIKSFLYTNSYALSHVLAALMILLNIIPSINPAMHTYSSEAFPLNKRNSSLAFITSLDYILNVIPFFNYYVESFDQMIWSDNLHNLVTLIMIFLSILVIVKLPETKNKSIRQCRAEFNSFHLTKTENIELL